jgi:hypothetical protein
MGWPIFQSLGHSPKLWGLAVLGGGMKGCVGRDSSSVLKPNQFFRVRLHFTPKLIHYV